jgi:hypothetical protein
MDVMRWSGGLQKNLSVRLEKYDLDVRLLVRWVTEKLVRSTGKVLNVGGWN